MGYPVCWSDLSLELLYVFSAECTGCSTSSGACTQACKPAGTWVCGRACAHVFVHGNVHVTAVTVHVNTYCARARRMCTLPRVKFYRDRRRACLFFPCACTCTMATAIMIMTFACAGPAP